MTSTFTVRADSETERELAELVQLQGGNRNAVVRDAIHLAYRQLVLDQVRQETEALANDSDDLAEVQRVQEDLEALRAW